ncbi:MAG: ABC transporter permease [Candidatus Acidiferrales bacterium]|jgi:putative ABC transport system permease protein
MFLNALFLALKEMRRNLMRSFLTVLGIVIGVCAVITMVSLGNGATKAVSDQIASLGSNLLIVSPGQRPGAGRGGANAPPFKIADANAIQSQIGGLKAVAPTASQGVTAVSGARNWTTSVTGSTNDYFTTGNWQLSEGRTFTDAEQHAGKAVCILGETVRKKLFGGQNPVGGDIRLRNVSCEVIGLLASKGQASMGRDQDDIVVTPLRTLQRRLSGKQDVGAVMVSANEGASMEKLKEQIEQLMRERRRITGDKEDDFNVLDTKEIAETVAGATRVLTALLGAVAAVSLLVGGIGIMNIMLVSITERTREIGTRLAIGALEREVLLQFLVEAVTLSCFGGAIGLALATIASLALAKIMQVPYVFNPQIDVLAFVFAAIIGVMFGYLPAKRAARLDPIEALRHE